MPIEVGQTVSDYQILELLGRGGMGRVYRVRNIISHRVEAMKVLLDDLSADPDLADRFMAEIRTLARLDHPNIAKLHTAFSVENRLVMIMELLEGSTLAERLKQGPMPLSQAVDVTAQTLSALGYAHQAGVIHRDVKPSNVMISPHGIAKLMDFGIAKSDVEHNQTRTGMTMGSMLYMSPEQVLGSTVDARSDIYSVGVMLYELSTGKRPFDSENTHGLLEAHLNQQPPPITDPSLPPLLNDIVLTAMAKEPMRRFQSADAFRKAVESLVARPSEVKTAAAQAAPAQGNTPPKNKRGLWMALGAAACVCVLVGAAVTLPHFFSSHAASPSAHVAVPIQPKASPEPSASLATTQAAPSVPSAEPAPEVPPNAVTPPPVRAATSAAPVVAKPNVLPTPAQPQQSPAPPIESPTPQPQAPVPAGPSPEQVEAANDDLMKLHARADAVRGSLDHLRSEQAASGLNLNPTVSAGASRMDNYLHAADQALQNNNLDSARKYIDRADTEVTKLESFFGR
jgi:hypothetical protein